MITYLPTCYVYGRPKVWKYIYMYISYMPTEYVGSDNEISSNISI